jgi:hypothetical protein
MSMLRKTVLATVIAGAGLGALSGTAMAHDHQAAAKGCSNTVKAESENGAGRTAGDTTGGAQDLTADNICDIANGNTLLSDNNVAGGDIRNGDLTETTRTSTDVSNEQSNTTLPAAPAGAGDLGLGELLGGGFPF